MISIILHIFNYYLVLCFVQFLVLIFKMVGITLLKLFIYILLLLAIYSGSSGYLPQYEGLFLSQLSNLGKVLNSLYYLF